MALKSSKTCKHLQFETGHNVARKTSIVGKIPDAKNDHIWDFGHTLIWKHDWGMQSTIPNGNFSYYH
jgi:hypothetical protein